MLTKSQKADLLGVLKSKNIGNPKQRESFILDVDRRLEFLHDLVTLDPEPELLKPRLEAIEKAALRLAKEIERNKDAHADIRFVFRRYDAQPLALPEGISEMCSQVTVLAFGCKQARAILRARRGPRTGMAREFISQIAEAYELAFDKHAAASRSGPFGTVVTTVAQAVEKWITPHSQFNVGEKALITVLKRRNARRQRK